MSQRCPVCKTRLWTDPIFTPSRLVCPRCGAVFKPTVPWAAFRIMVVVVLILSITLVFFLARHKPWLVAFLAVLLLFLWFLPRLVNLQHISSELGLSEGVMDPDRMRLSFDDKCVEKREQGREERTFRSLVYLFLMVIVLALALIWVLRGA